MVRIAVDRAERRAAHCVATIIYVIDREFVASAKKFANFNEFSEINKIRKNSYKKSLNARVGVAFQWSSLLNIYFFVIKFER